MPHPPVSFKPRRIDTSTRPLDAPLSPLQIGSPREGAYPVPPRPVRRPRAGANPRSHYRKRKMTTRCAARGSCNCKVPSEVLVAGTVFHWPSRSSVWTSVKFVVHSPRSGMVSRGSKPREWGRHGARPSVPHRRVEQDARRNAASLEAFSERAEHLRKSVRLVCRGIAPRHNGATQRHGIDDAVAKQLLGVTAEGLHILYERRHAKHHSIVVEATGLSWHPCEPSQKNRQQTAPLRDGSCAPLRTFQDHFSTKVNQSPSFAPFTSLATRPDETRKPHLRS